MATRARSLVGPGPPWSALVGPGRHPAGTGLLPVTGDKFSVSAVAWGSKRNGILRIEEGTMNQQLLDLTQRWAGVGAGAGAEAAWTPPSTTPPTVSCRHRWPTSSPKASTGPSAPTSAAPS